MTREEAIRWLKVINTKEFGWDEFALQESQREIRERCEQGVREAIDMAIEALSADAVIQECRTHGRLIDADELKKHLDGAWEELNDDGERKGVRLARWYLISAPTVSADAVQGEWIDRSNGGRIKYPWWESCECNQCGEYGSGAYNYCPNCGARMEANE